MLKIIEVPIKSIKKSKFFKRRHTADQMNKCIHSLKTYGQYSPIVVSGHEILCGNLVYDAMKRLGFKKINIVQLGELSEVKKKEIRFLDNHTFDISSWNDIALKDLLMMLDVGDLPDYGYTKDETFALVNDLDVEERKIADLENDLKLQPEYCCEYCGWTGRINKK